MRYGLHCGVLDIKGPVSHSRFLPLSSMHRILSPRMASWKPRRSRLLRSILDTSKPKNAAYQVTRQRPRQSRALPVPAEIRIMIAELLGAKQCYPLAISQQFYFLSCATWTVCSSTGYFTALDVHQQRTVLEQVGLQWMRDNNEDINAQKLKYLC
jgi:hypothetical protein